MQFQKPAGPNPTDRQRVLGKPTPRIDGPAKTTGTATYAYEFNDVAPNLAYGYILGAGVAKGRITSMDVAAAKKSAGVLDVVTYKNAGEVKNSDFNTAPLLAGPDVTHYHQAVAMVVAETFEQARAAASLIKVGYQKADGAYELAERKDSASVPKDDADTRTGDYETAFANAPVKVDVTYTTPAHAHAMMEPHATIALWEDGNLTLWSANQMIEWGKQSVATALGLDPSKVRMISPYIGGGFGGKLFIRADAVLAAIGARLTGRPVKVALQRPLVFNNTVHRPATIQRITLGAGEEGKLLAIGHENWSGNLEGGDAEQSPAATRPSYAAANRLAVTKLAVLDLPEGNAMRAPGDAPGSMTIEAAMDELAHELGLDPIELRAINDTQVHPESGKPFSRRKLMDCYREGASRFGWSKRSMEPGKVRDGDEWVGMGVASAIRGAPVMTSAARVSLRGDGSVLVETDMTDIGTGSYTILGQTAAEMLGVPLERVEVRLGDSNFPVSAGSGGQWGATSSTSGVYAACNQLRTAIANAVGVDANAATFADGRVSAGGEAFDLTEAGALTETGEVTFGGRGDEHEYFTFGAHFVELGVNAYTAEIRLRRMLAVCDAGRIFNPTSAKNQVMGGMTMGAGAALLEELVVDPRYGFFANHDLAQYEVPVHADIPQQEVIFLDGEDPLASPMKGSGVGELGICGPSAAIANAVFNATGIRVRDYPITMEKLLPRMPTV
ncbi:xanthine dehydrogenase family protein molybdopterin-binding subunit [Parvularcula dongshanensis]|uniref:Xanthine dehydrogenase YagR molybdenum-binding subunit n=1 Tax=Parvularcula dongshanensis TaxID=1173995 RepID=A0A840HZK4_9PROT|nr:xanthine dehydrogenase family protein molybdopterin-binding subunit [Parvularcula dongshanensis]MBB4657535.1 xanthine dehydrogenase YagR molybdenum-binding subunit [Parvularcula dongshanensis]